ncbi:MAG: OmpA family protein [Terriglobia bacterium]
MQKVMRTTLGLLAALALGAQEPPPPRLPATVQAIEVEAPGGAILSFRPRGTTTVELKGTERMPNAAVALKVESRPGFVEIDINRGAIKGLRPAWRFGRDFLTYVLWVVSVDGAAMNVGEITFEHGIPISINVTTTYQTFWMMVTAEPDFAVHDPSPVVVLISQSQEETPSSHKARPVPGKLIYYTNYTKYDRRPPGKAPAEVPAELLQARKAVELAAQAGILAQPTPAEEEPLPDEDRTRQTLQLAQAFLGEAEAGFQGKSVSPQTIQFARTAAQIAENARALALGAVGGIALRQLSREIERLQAQKSQTGEQLAEAQRELASLRDRLTQLEASLDQERRRTRQLEGEMLALQERANVLERVLAGADQESVRLRQERDKICAELRRQLASLGQLTEEGGRLVLTLASDILFDFNRYDLRPAARENLAKLAIVRLLLFPTAEVRYEGHTDLVGEEAYNQWLSEQRALSVYHYFLQERLARSANEEERAQLEERWRGVKGLLKMSYNAARRQPNRRQELLAALGDTVVGKGMREPVVPERGPNERNRRVALIFPQVERGEVTSLCAPGPPAR